MIAAKGDPKAICEVREKALLEQCRANEVLESAGPPFRWRAHLLSVHLEVGIVSICEYDYLHFTAR